ncbi:MAG: hypothetical protein AAGK02_00795 [Pseudomonadota bacterium]
MASFGVIDSTYASVQLYLPELQWDYLRWLMSQGFDLHRFTKSCDRRRRAIIDCAMTDQHIGLSDFISFATDRLHQLHYAHHAEDQNLVQPVFHHQISQAIDKAEVFFRNSGARPMRWSGWRA